MLFDESTYKQVLTMRRMVAVLGGMEGLELLLARLIKTKTNVEGCAPSFRRLFWCGSWASFAPNVHSAIQPSA
jgi:hypothetical protein